MACILGPILQPNNHAVFQSTTFPYAVTFQIGSDSSVNEFIVQISTSVTFNTISGYVTASSSSESYININEPGTYYVRASCDGSTWTGIITFTVEQIAAGQLSSITEYTMTLNTTSNGFLLTIPQLRSGPILEADLTPTSSIFNYLDLMEVEISTDPSFQTNVSRFYYEQYTFGDLYNVEVNNIPNFSLANTYFSRLRLYNANLKEWEPYTNLSISYIGTGNDNL